MKPIRTILQILFALSLILLTAADCNGPTPPEEEELWKKIAVPEGMGYYALDFLSPTEGWSCGYKSIGYWDGEDWKVVKSFGDDNNWYLLDDVHIVDNSNIWFSGTIEHRTKSYSSVVLHYIGGNWIETNIPEASTIIGIWMFPNGTGWGGGGSTNGTFYYDGTNWTKHNDLPIKAFQFFTSNDGWGIGLGSIYHWDGTEWTESLTAEGVWFRDIYFTASNNGWAVSHPSLYGVAAHYHWDGTEWTKLQGTPFDETSLDAVHFLNSDWGWAIGSGRTYFYDREYLIWEEYPYAGDSSSYHVNDIYCLSETNVWISSWPDFMHFTGFE